MPLSDPAPRDELHTRRLECRGYERADGLYDIEGHLVDTKTYGFESDWRGKVEPGVPVHDMWIRLTVDANLQIHKVEAVTDYGPFPMCPDVTANFKKLEGLKIRPGWMRKVREAVGGVRGCTHIAEMLAQVATTAFQTMVRRRAEQRRKEREKGGKEGPRRAPPMLLNSCYAWSSDSEVVKALMPDHYTGD